MYKDATELKVAYSNYKDVLYKSTRSKKMLDEAVEKMTESREALAEFSEKRKQSRVDLRNKWGIDLSKGEA